MVLAAARARPVPLLGLQGPRGEALDAHAARSHPDLVVYELRHKEKSFLPLSLSGLESFAGLTTGKKASYSLVCQVAFCCSDGPSFRGRQYN